MILSATSCHIQISWSCPTLFSLSLLICKAYPYLIIDLNELLYKKGLKIRKFDFLFEERSKVSHLGRVEKYVWDVRAGSEWRFDIVTNDWKESCVRIYNRTDNVDVMLGPMSRKTAYWHYPDINNKIRKEYSHLMLFYSSQRMGTRETNFTWSLGSALLLRLSVSKAENQLGDGISTICWKRKWFNFLGISEFTRLKYFSHACQCLKFL